MRAVDLFAGAGGFSTGATAAGCSVLWAGDHWPEALRIHQANHPRAQHVCQDLLTVDWRLVPEHELLLASPSCVGHSRARGRERAHHDAQRSTAWAVVSAAEGHRPPVVLVENVIELTKWELFPAWSAAMSALGYACAVNKLNAADFGVPQSRWRVFIVFTRSKAPLVLNLPRLSEVPASDIVDFGAGVWSQVDRKGRAPRTLARVQEGRAVHGRRFLMSYYGSTRGGRSLSRPLGTLTTRDRHALVDGSRMRMLTVDEVRAGMGFPVGYVLPSSRRQAVHMLGNAVCPPVAAALITAIRKHI